ncbi:MAG: hypothetical protein N2595_09375 [bacterium]|nr:hypothetical protein [bacterium]
MRRFSTFLSLTALVLAAPLLAAPPYAPGLNGDWNFTSANVLYPQTGLYGPGTTFWARAFSNIPLDREFKITRDANWNDNWGGGYWIYDNAVYTPPKGGNNMVYKQGTTAPILFLSVNNPEANPNNLPLHVQRFSSSPVSITWTADSLGSSYSGNRRYTAGSNYVVICSVGASRPSEQKIYFRYTFDAWTNSTIKELTGAANQTMFTNTIVLSYGQILDYYLLTSARTAADLATDTDLKTVTYDTRNGYNYIVTGWLDSAHAAFIPGQYTAPDLWWGFGIFNRFTPTLLYGGHSNYWACTIFNVTNNHEFKLTFGPGWTTNWGANSTTVKLSVAPNATNTGYRLAGSANMEFNNAWGNGAVAHFQCYIPQDGNNQLAFGVQKFTAAPTQISSVADDLTSPLRQRQAGVATLVTAQVTRTTLLAEEKLYLRYSSNNWANHFLVPMTKVADYVYVATLPPMGGSEANVITTEYYVLSSTLTEAELAVGNNQYVDLLTAAHKLGPNNKNFVIYNVPEPAAWLIGLLAAFRLGKRK